MNVNVDFDIKFDDCKKVTILFFNTMYRVEVW